MSNEKKKYKVNTAMNFSIGSEEYYLTEGAAVELPSCEFVSDLITRNHIEELTVTKEPTEKTNTKK